jgi:hypothetical protein
MDWHAAIHYASLVKAAEDIPPDTVCGSTVMVPLHGTPIAYTVSASIFANDLATDSNVAGREIVVSIGFVAQDDAGNVVIVIRGTKGIHEWIHDFRYFAVACPFLQDAGHTEDGFTEMYLSLRVGAHDDGPRVRDAIAKMAFPRPVTSLTVCGHSLGAALATLLALDLAANTQYKDVSLFTYASPRTGDHRFATVFNQYVPKTIRIANSSDLVTEVPPDLMEHLVNYRHVEATEVIDPGDRVEKHIVCQHHLTTYLYLMAAEAGLAGDEYALREECRPAAKRSWVPMPRRRPPDEKHSGSADLPAEE